MVVVKKNEEYNVKQKKIREVDGCDGIIFYKGKNYIHKSLIGKFDRIYKHVQNEPNTERIAQINWDLFCDFVPDSETEEKVLVTVMEELTKVLIKKIKEPLAIYYAIEYQPNAKNHIHYLVKSDYNSDRLDKLIKDTINIYLLSDQYIDKFIDGLKYNAIDYFTKGKGGNLKNAKFVSSKLITKQIRR